jgi:hypothetical protein
LIRLNPGVPRGGVTSDQATQPKGERFRYSQVKPSCDPCSGICSFFEWVCFNLQVPCRSPASTWFEFVCVCGHCHVDDLRLHVPSTAWHQFFFLVMPPQGMGLGLVSFLWALHPVLFLFFFEHATPRHGPRVSLFSVGISPSAFFFEHAAPRHGSRVSCFFRVFFLCMPPQGMGLG